MWAFYGLEVLFAQLGALNRGDAGAHNEQHTVRHAAEDGGIGDDRDGGRVNDHIIEGVLQRLKIFSVAEEASSSAGFGGMVPTGRTVMPVPSSG